MTSGSYHETNAARGPVIAASINGSTTGRFRPDTAALAAVRACGRCSPSMLIMPRRGLLAAAIGLLAAGRVPRSSPAATDDGGVPADFVLAASTPSHQVEGAVDGDRRRGRRRRTRQKHLGCLLPYAGTREERRYRRYRLRPLSPLARRYRSARTR